MVLNCEKCYQIRNKFEWNITMTDTKVTKYEMLLEFWRKCY